MKKTLFIFTVLFISLNLYSYENFRVRKTVLADLSDELTSSKVELGINDALAIKVPTNPLFLKGISLEVKIPEVVAEFTDSVAYSIYSNVTPRPTEKGIDYNGKRLLIDTFPITLSCNLLIPLFSSTELKDSHFSVVLPSVMDDKSGYVFFRLQLVMKGTSPAIHSSKFIIEVKPILDNKGALVLDVLAPDLSKKADISDSSIGDVNAENQNFDGSQADGKNPEMTSNPAELSSTGEAQEGKKPEIINVGKTNLISLFIDGKSPVYKDDKIMLEPGNHHLSIVSDLYRSEVRTINIEQGRISNLEVLLKDITPLVEITAPEGIQVFLDSQELSSWNEPFPVKEGVHFIKFLFGGYEKTQSFEAFNGKNYKFSLDLDIEMAEE